MPNAARKPVRFCHQPGGPNPLTEDEAQHLASMDPQALFAAGYNTREIAQIWDRPESDVYNFGVYRRV